MAVAVAAGSRGGGRQRVERRPQRCPRERGVGAVRVRRSLGLARLPHAAPARPLPAASLRAVVPVPRDQILVLLHQDLLVLCDRAHGHDHPDGRVAAGVGVAQAGAHGLHVSRLGPGAALRHLAPQRVHAGKDVPGPPRTRTRLSAGPAMTHTGGGLSQSSGVQGAGGPRGGRKALGVGDAGVLRWRG
eukprot:COSAG01_NODE_433_length_17113_cov_23.009757_23_plen_188_part_00